MSFYRKFARVREQLPCHCRHCLEQLGLTPPKSDKRFREPGPGELIRLAADEEEGA